MQAKTNNLEKTVAIYRQRLKELSEHIPRPELEQLMQRMGVKDLFEVPAALENSSGGGNMQITATMNGNQFHRSSSSSDGGNLLIETADSHEDQHAHMKCPPVPSRNLPGLDVFKSASLNGGGGSNGHSKNDELLLNSDSDSDFDPRAFESDDSKTTNDFFGFEPTKTLGQQIFAATNSHHSHSSSGNSNNNHFVNNMNAVNTSVTNGNGAHFSLAMDTNNNNNNSSINGAVPAPLRK